MIYWQLILVYLKIGMFGFGGGYAMLSLIQYEVVDHHHWLTLQQFTDVVAISQMTPGPIGINSATYVGYAVTQSVWGAVVATVAVCLPSFILSARTRPIIQLPAKRPNINNPSPPKESTTEASRAFIQFCSTT